MQTKASTFLDDLLSEIDQKETQNVQAYNDLIAMEVIRLENEITANFLQAEVECKIINEWALKRNTVIQESANLLKMKLEAFIRTEGKKTISLPHAELKIRKNPDRVEIIDVDLFLANANAEMITVIPESIKADLTKIKSYMKMTGKIPQGVNVIEGKEEFKLSLRKEIVSPATPLG